MLPRSKNKDTHIASFSAAILTPLLNSFDEIKGERTVMLGYKLGRIRREMFALHRALLDGLEPYMDEENPGAFRATLSEKEKGEVEEILNEVLTVNLPSVTLQELHDAGLRVEDDAILPAFVEAGIFKL